MLQYFSDLISYLSGGEKKSLDRWKIDCQGKGVQMEENKCQFSFDSADDQAIIAQDADDLEYILKIPI